MQTRQQRMLRKAIDDVSKVRDKAKDIQKAYGGLCHKLPVLIRTCGLCQAIAFVESKQKDPHKLILAHAKGQLVAQNVIANDNTSLTSHIVGLSVDKYTLATRILLEALVYYKRLAESILGVKQGEGEEGVETND